MYDMEATPTTHTHTHSPHGRLTAPAMLYSQQMRGPLSECAAIFISDSGSQRSRSGGSRAWRHAPLISCCWRPKERRLTEIKPRLDVEEGSRARRLWECLFGTWGSICLCRHNAAAAKASGEGVQTNRDMNLQIPRGEPQIYGSNKVQLHWYSWKNALS